MLNTLNIKKIVYSSFAVFALLNILSAFLSPVDQEALIKYNISEFQLRIIIASLLLPVMGIWVCAAYGFVHFKQYALSIKGSAPGKGTNTVANGLGIIAMQLIVSGGFSTLTSIDSIKDTLGGDGGIEIISTGITIIFSLIAAALLYKGASQLNASLAKPSRPKIFTKSLYVLVATSLAFLTAIVLKYPTSGSTESIYEYVPLGAAIVGVWAPYLVIWTCYLLAARNLHYYQHHVKGKVYKQALGLLVTGTNFILGSSVFIQLLGAFNSALSDAPLVPILILVYVLIAVIGLGYLCIARAATRLRGVES